MMTAILVSWIVSYWRRGRGRGRGSRREGGVSLPCLLNREYQLYQIQNREQKHHKNEAFSSFPFCSVTYNRTPPVCLSCGRVLESYTWMDATQMDATWMPCARLWSYCAYTRTCVCACCVRVVRVLIALGWCVRNRWKKRDKESSTEDED